VREQKGVELDRRQVVLAEHLKSVGTHELTVSLFGDVETTFSVEVAPTS
jgi:ribosomal protein L9